jgi:hypothetical protein
VRADWEHIATRVADLAAVEAQVRKEVEQIEGFQDEVIVDMALRHVCNAPVRCQPDAL